MQKKLGEKLASLRKEKGLTQQEIAGRIGVSAKTISKWEIGQTMPDITILNNLAQVLNVKTSIFFDNAESINNVTKEIKLNFIASAVSLGIGICVFVLNLLDKITIESSVSLLAIGLIVLSFSQIINKE